jgi:branched-chain amino acid transport system permease protein
VSAILSDPQVGTATAPPPGPGRRRPTRLVPLLGIAVLAAAPLLLDNFYLGVVTRILIYGLWALSLAVLFRAGLVSLGHAAFLGTAAYTVAYAQAALGWPWLLAVGAALVVTVLLGVVFGAMVARTTGVYCMVITLAQGMMLWGVAQQWSTVTGGEMGLSAPGRPAAIAGRDAFYWFVLAVVVGSVLLITRYLRSLRGQRLLATRDSPTRMASLGYRVEVERFIGFNVGALFAGVAGVLYLTYYQFVSPGTVHVRHSVEPLIMVVLGGVQAIVGPLVGAAGLVSARTAISMVSDRWPTVLGLLLILSVLFLRQGLTGAIQSGATVWSTRLTRRARDEADRPAAGEDPEPTGSG